MNYFIQSLNRFVCFFLKNANALLVFFKWVPYMQISDMILGVNIIGEKVNAASVIGGFGGVLKNPAGVLGSRAA